MDHTAARRERLSAYSNTLSQALGDGRRAGPMTSYCTGLLLPAARKSVEPMAPPRSAAARLSSKNLPFPKVTARGALPIRTERHVPNSLPTLRHELVVGLASRLDRRPCCAQPQAK